MAERRRDIGFHRQRLMSEADEQKSVICWWKAYSIKREIENNLLIHIPNEGIRSPAMCAHLYSQGMRKGAPDLFLAIPSGIYHGLFIEMKRVKGGVVSKEQKAFISLLNGCGYKACVCKGAEEAINIITKYIENQE